MIPGGAGGGAGAGPSSQAGVIPGFAHLAPVRTNAASAAERYRSHASALISHPHFHPHPHPHPHPQKQSLPSQAKPSTEAPPARQQHPQRMLDLSHSGAPGFMYGRPQHQPLSPVRASRPHVQQQSFPAPNQAAAFTSSSPSVKAEHVAEGANASQANFGHFPQGNAVPYSSRFLQVAAELKNSAHSAHNANEDSDITMPRAPLGITQTCDLQPGSAHDPSSCQLMSAYLESPVTASALYAGGLFGQDTPSNALLAMWQHSANLFSPHPLLGGDMEDGSGTDAMFLSCPLDDLIYSDPQLRSYLSRS
eukprot:gene26823-4417_t